MTGRLTTGQAAEALGVRPATVYAYVSRGVLARTTEITGSGQRVSSFDRAEVMRLAELRSRPRAGSLAFLVESDITQLDPRGTLAFRGHDLRQLVAAGTYEDAVAVLWQQSPGPWPPVDAELMRAAAAAWPSGPDRPADRIRAAVLHAAAADPDRGDLSPDHVLWVARSVVQLAIAAVGRCEPEGTGVAAALWNSLTGIEADDKQCAALDAVLTVLLDHELTASTLATRIAAGLHCDPWMALLTGLSAMSGSRQAGAGPQASQQIQTWLSDGQLRESIAGFGHKVYEGLDPRADLLFDVVDSLDPLLMESLESLIAEVAVQHSILPNVDLAVAAVVRALQLPVDATEVLFMIGRIAGLAAHAVEEYPHGLRFRARTLGNSSHTR
jgi:citrate synthase